MGVLHRFRRIGGFFVALVVALVMSSAAHAITNTWRVAGDLITGRLDHTATLLPSGLVLIVGGRGSGQVISAELYDSATNRWRAAGSLTNARYLHTATLLPSGKVLIVGGFGNGGVLSSAELYDPATNGWSSAGNLSAARISHSATLLPSGKVLIAGGDDLGNSALATAELYDPGTNSWSAAGSLASARHRHTATTLSSGKVLIVGGLDNNFGLASSELYDPTTNSWSTTASLATVRYGHTATQLPSGKVLVVAGFDNSGILANAELYDPSTSSWNAGGSLATRRHSHSATLLPSGQVLVSGGYNGSSSLTSVELYDPATNSWHTTSSLSNPHRGHTATLLASGQVLVAGGYGNNSFIIGAESYDPGASSWSVSGNLTTYRYDTTATLLSSGQVLVAGGIGGTVRAEAERYNSTTNTWSSAGRLLSARYLHTATALPSGQVLLVGGYDFGGALASAERYDSIANTWSAAGTLATARALHTATLLPSGKVLIAGGANASGALASVELYDPSTNSWSAAGSLGTARYRHTATLLTSGRVLVVGGQSAAGHFASAELYDPATNSWTTAGNLATARSSPSATLLPSGLVLIVGGSGNSTSALASAELYNPATNSWSAAGSLSSGRGGPTATLLPSGLVLVAAGAGASGPLASAELYDPATNSWSAAGSLLTARYSHAATLLPTGQVLVVGGANGGALNSVERYALDLGIVGSRRPLITSFNSTLGLGQSLQVTGSRFTGDSEASSGGTNSSATNFPLLQLRRLDNDHVVWTSPAPGASRSDTSYGSAPLANLPLGPYALTMFVNGISSTAEVIRLVSSHAVTPSAGSNGAISPSTVQIVADEATAEFIVTPAAGYHVANVGGTCGGTLSGSIYVTGPVTADCTVTASFAIYTYTVSASAGANGTIAPATQVVDHGATATFTVTPAVGYHIASVSGCDGSLSGSTYTTGPITADCPVTASFAINTYTVSASAVANGTITPATQTVNHGATTSFTVTPAAGYHVASVSGCGGSLSGSTYTTGPITADCPVTASFAINTYTVSANAGANGTIAPATQTVNHGATTTFAVTPAAGYHVASVSGCGGSLSGSTYTTGPITADCPVTASFAINTYTVSANAGANGTITPATQTVNHGSTTTFIITPAAGYHTDDVGGTCGGALSGSAYTTNAVTADCTVTVSFAINTYTVSASAGANGAITPATQTVNHGSTTSFTITPVAGYHIDDVGGTCGGSLNGGIYTTAAVVADCTVAATFAVNPSASLAITIDDGRDYARYGMILDYVITVTNEGPGDATDAVLANTLPLQLDAAHTSWVCLGGDGGAACTASGNGALNDSNIAIPAGRSLTWLLSAPVLFDAVGATVDNTVSISGNGSTSSATDSDTLVIFRDGFDVPYGDGTHGTSADIGISCVDQQREIFDVMSVRVVTLPIMASRAPLDTILVARSDEAEGFRIERLNLGTAPRVRLVTVAKSGVERASAWATTATDASLALAMVEGADGTRTLLLEGATPSLVLPLSAGFADTLRIHALNEGACVN